MAQRDKCSAGRAKRTVVLSAEWIWEAKQSPCSHSKPHFTPALTERVNIASHRCTMHRPPMWRETNSWRVQRTPFSPFQSTSTSACSSELQWQVDYFREEHLPHHSPGFHKNINRCGLMLEGQVTCFQVSMAAGASRRMSSWTRNQGFLHLLSVHIDEAKEVSRQKAASHQLLSWTHSCF